MRSQNLRARVGAALDEIEEPARTAFALRFGFGDGYVYTLVEVSKILRRSETEVGELFESARASLLRQLAESGGVSLEEFEWLFHVAGNPKAPA